MTSGNSSTKKPYFPFYPGDFLMATGHWTNAEVGAYLRLLCHQWANGSVPADERRISNIVGVHGADFIEMWSVVRAKFTADGEGRLVNPRLEKVRAEVDDRSDKARKAAQQRWSIAQADAKRDAKPMPSKSKSKSKIKVKTKTKQKAAMPPIPKELDTPEFKTKWQEWLKFRRTYKKPVNPPGARTSLKRLEALGPTAAVAVIDTSIANDWQGLFPERSKANPESRVEVGFDGVARPVDRRKPHD